MEMIAIIFGVFGVGFWLGIAVQRIAVKSNMKKQTVEQQNIKEKG